jgi:hypothetical protein
MAMAIDVVACFLIIMGDRWNKVSDTDPRRVLAQKMVASVRARGQQLKLRGVFR